MRRLSLAALAVLVVAGGRAARAEEAEPFLHMRLVPIREGLRVVSPGDDLDNARRTEIYRLARAVGVDLLEPEHPLLVERYRDGRLFYVFYKTVEDAYGGAYLIQRIKKTERFWSAPDAEPTERVTYLVEVFRMQGGALKGNDQHHGSFGLRQHHRREIVKEYEIGFGRIPGLAEGDAWPFDARWLFRKVQDYQPEREAYDRVVFERSTTWSLRVAFDAEGHHEVRADAFSFAAPTSMPPAEAGAPRPKPASEDLVLVAGEGPGGVLVGEGTEAALVEALGEPLAVVPLPRGRRNLVLPAALTAHVAVEGRVRTLFTNPGFLGRTAEGVRHGTPRWEVMKIHGPPRDAKADDGFWRYDGVAFWFDAFHRVRRIVIVAR